MTYCTVQTYLKLAFLHFNCIIWFHPEKWDGNKYAKYGKHTRPESCEDDPEKFEVGLKFYLQISQCGISHWSIYYVPTGYKLIRYAVNRLLPACSCKTSNNRRDHTCVVLLLCWKVAFWFSESNCAEWF